MSFSPEWLALREPADHLARNSQVREAALASFSNAGSARIVDLGCGAGSNLRALAPHLPGHQSWRLVDYDPALLEAARSVLSAWADEAASGDGETLHLRKDDKQIVIAFEQADLASHLEEVLDQPADLVTAAAFFDLVAPAWIERFCDALVARRLPLYTVLTYDGVERWRPPHPADAQVLAAFIAHQATDKGFGPAAGPNASALLKQHFDDAGWRVVTGPSPWALDQSQDRRLMRDLASGIADAVAETSRVSPPDLASWRAARLSAHDCEIGHIDLFAAPRA